MNWITHFFEILLGMGPSVMIPLFVILIGLCLRVKAGQAVKAGLTTGACLIGATIIANLLGTNLSAIGQTITASNGFAAQVTDVG